MKPEFAEQHKDKGTEVAQALMDDKEPVSAQGGVTTGLQRGQRLGSTHMTVDTQSQDTGEEDGDAHSDIVSTNLNHILSSAHTASDSTMVRRTAIPSANSLGDVDTADKGEDSYRSITLPIVACLCIAIVFLLFSLAVYLQSSLQRVNFLENKGMSLEEDFEDLEMGTFPKEFIEDAEAVDAAASQETVVYHFPSSDRGLICRGCRPRSASAPTGHEHSIHVKQRHCAKCSCAISTKEDAFLALDQIFCSTQCRGDAVCEFVHSNGPKLPRSATRTKSLEDICLDSY